MLYPMQRILPRRRQTLDRFYGLEHRADVREGAFYDAENLRPDAWPILRTRPARKRWTQWKNGEALSIETDTPVTAAAEVNGGLCICSETGVYLNGRRVENCTFDMQPARRQILPFGRNVFIAPDGKYIAPDGVGAPRVRHAAFCKSDVTVRLSYGFAPGVGGEFMFNEAGDTTPVNPFSGMYWLDTSGEPPVLLYRGDDGWERGVKVFLILEGDGIGDTAEEGDKVFLSGAWETEQAYTVAFVQPDKIWLAGKYKMLPDLTAAVTLEKRIPLLDHAVEHNNRIWGCRYGANGKGEFVNEIYASALGDPTVWEKYDGGAADSYCVSLGCSGAFTGVCAVDGALLFFKENCIIRVTGSMPSEYTVTVLPARGVAEGAERSLVNLNERAFYQSITGVTAYDGALPVSVSDPLADYRFSDVLAAAYNGKYYMAATTQDGKRQLFVFDSRSGLWQKEDDEMRIRFFVTLGGRLYYLCPDGNSGVRSALILADGSFAGAPEDLLRCGDQGREFCWTEEEAPEWYALSGPLDAGNNTKILRRLIFRLELGPDSSFSVSLLPDGDGREIPLCRVFRQKPGVFSVPVNTPRCHSYRLRLRGKGACTLFSVTAVTERTGEVSGLGD